MFRRAFEIIFLFLFFAFYGCAKDHLIRRQESIADRKVLSLFSEFSVKVFSRDDVAFSLNSQIKDIAFVRDSIKLEELYERGSGGGGDIMAILGAVIGLGGLIGGCSYAESTDLVNDTYKIPGGCIISCTSGLLGAAMISEGGSQAEEFVKVLPDYIIRRDTICVDSVFLLKQKVEVLIEKMNFEKIYWTDKNGNIELKFNEIIPEPTEKDSIIDIVIQYEELADTVNVEFR